MPSHPLQTKQTPSLFRALPPYLGGKRRLVPLIFAELASVLPRAEWSGARFVDPFCGGGAVSLLAKAHGFDVHASDLALRAVIPARALIANSGVRLRPIDALGLFLPSESESLANVPTDILTGAQAAWFATALSRAWQRPEPLQSLSLLLAIKLFLRSMPMSMPAASDAQAAAHDDFDRVSSRRLGSYLRGRRQLAPAAVLRLAEQINAGVTGGSGSATQQDALPALAEGDAEVVYLDPPYAGTSSYEREYRLLDQLLGDTPAPGPPPTLDALFDASPRSALLVLSYGGPTITLERLSAIVARHRPILHALSVPYRHLGPLATEQKNATNREFIIVAGLP